MKQLGSSLSNPMRSCLHIIKCDVSDMVSVNKAFVWIEDHLSGVDILINNAGVHIKRKLLTMNINDVEKTLHTNIIAMAYCDRRGFNSMKNRNVNGHIVLINSILGHSVSKMAPLRHVLITIQCQDVLQWQ